MNETENTQESQATPTKEKDPILPLYLIGFIVAAGTSSAAIASRSETFAKIALAALLIFCLVLGAAIVKAGKRPAS